MAVPITIATEDPAPRGIAVYVNTPGPGLVLTINLATGVETIYTAADYYGEA